VTGRPPDWDEAERLQGGWSTEGFAKALRDELSV
jgi:hypothetical protein